MNIRLKSTILIIVCGVLFASQVVFVQTVFAQNVSETKTNSPVVNTLSNTDQELGISPFLQEFEVAKGATTSSTINVSNTGTEPITVTISTKDFLPGERGEPEFIPDDEINETTFSLASWVKIKGSTVITIAPNSVTQIEYSVTPPVNAEQGSHYGAILFSYSSNKQLSGVGITQAIGSIIIVGYGEARSNGTINFYSDKNLSWWNNKIEFTNIFSNIGNVHVKPKGEVSIKNMFGQVVATPAVNRDAANVLPKSDRTFISSWQPGAWSFGRYKAESLITYGRERLEVRAVQIIWILPLYILFVIGIFIALVLWYLLHGRHWHRRRIIRKHLERQSKLNP